MTQRRRENRFTGQISYAIGGAILLAGIILTVHPWILTVIGFAGGFQFLVHTGLVYLGTGIGILLVLTAGYPIRPQSSLGVLAVTLCTTALLMLVEPGPHPAIERYLLYVPAMAAFPIGVATGDRHRHLLISLLGGSALSVVTGYAFALSGSPQGPIGLFLLWLSVVVLVLSIPLLAVGRYFGQKRRTIVERRRM